MFFYFSLNKTSIGQQQTYQGQILVLDHSSEVQK